MPNIFPSGVSNIEKANILKYFQDQRKNAISDDEDPSLPSVFVMNLDEDDLHIFNSFHTNVVTLRLKDTLLSVRLDTQWREVTTNRSRPFITVETFFTPSSNNKRSAKRRRSFAEESIISSRLVNLFSEKTHTIFPSSISVTDGQTRYIPHFHISISLIADGGDVFEAAVCAVNFISLVHTISSPINAAETFYLSGDDSNRNLTGNQTSLAAVAAKFPFAMTVCTKFVDGGYVNVILPSQIASELADCKTVLLLSNEGVIDVTKYGGMEYDFKLMSDMVKEAEQVRLRLANDITKAAYERLTLIRDENINRNTRQTK